MLKKQFNNTISAILVIGLLFSFASTIFSTSAYAADEQFDWVVPRTWSYIGDFSEGLAFIQGYDENGGAGYYGFVDRFGEMKIPMQYECVKPFYDGLAPVMLGGKWGYINKNGDTVIDFQFDKASPFFEGLAVVGIRNDIESPNGNNLFNYGYINKTGVFVIEPKYQDAKRFSEGVAAVRMDAKWGYITPDGEIALDFKYQFAHSFHEGYAIAEVRFESFHEGEAIIDRSGNVIVEKLQEPATYQNGTIWLKSNGYQDAAYSDNKMGGYSPDDIVNVFSAEIRPHQFDDIKYSYYMGYSKEHDIIFGCDTENKIIYFFDHNFNLIHSSKNVRWQSIGYGIGTDGIISVGTYDNENYKMGYMDLNGNVVVEPFIWQANAFYEGRAVVYDNDRKYGIIRLNDDGALYTLPTDPLDTAHPIVMSINGVSQSIYSINGYGYIDVKVLPKYGFDVKINENNKNIFIEKNSMREKADIQDDFRYAEQYAVFKTDTTVYINNRVAKTFSIDGRIVVFIDQLGEFGKMRWNNNTKQTEFFVNEPYLPNEGITWEWVKYSDDIKYSGGNIYPVPDEYPLLKIEGRVHAGSGSYSAWGTVKYYDEANTLILDDDWSDAQPFTNKTALVMKGGTLQRGGMYGGKWGLIDTKGNYLVDTIWDYVERHSNGDIVFAIRNESDVLWFGITDGMGNSIIPMEYENIRLMRDGKHAVVGRDNSHGIIDMNNQLVFPYISYENPYEAHGIFGDSNITWYDVIDGFFNVSIPNKNYTGIAGFIDIPLLNGIVFVNSEKVEFDTPPLLINNRTMIPIRAVFEKLGCAVEWLGDSKTAMITLGDLRVEIKQDTNYIIKNGEYIYSDTAAINYNSRIYVPLRVISEALGCAVNYDEATGNVMIND